MSLIEIMKRIPKEIKMNILAIGRKNGTPVVLINGKLYTVNTSGIITAEA